MSEKNNIVIVKQPYKITMSKHRLNTYEMRVMMCMIKSLQPEMEFDKRPFEISKTNLGDTEILIPTKSFFPKNGIGSHRALRAALQSITRKPVEIVVEDEKGKKEEIFTNIVMHAKYDYRSEFVTLKICKEIIPHFVGLAKNYSKYAIEIAFNCSSPNTMKIYQFISHWRDKKQVYMNIDDLRSWLKIEDKYKYPTDIKRRILMPAMLELKKKSDVFFKVENHKEGRRVVGFKFNIYTKKDNTPKKQLPAKKDFAAKSEKQQRLFERLQTKFGLSARQAEKVVKNVDLVALSKVLYEINLQKLAGKVKNLGGYTARIIALKFDIKI